MEPGTGLGTGSSWGVKTVKRENLRGGAVALTMLIFWGVPLARADGDLMGAPPEVLRNRLSSEAAGKEQVLREAPFKFLKEVISRVDGPRCSMYPTDTQFALEAARRHGAVLGLLFLVDRLFHEWSESKTAPTILVHGKERFYDPLEANDFWLDPKPPLEDTSAKGPGTRP